MASLDEIKKLLQKEGDFSLKVERLKATKEGNLVYFYIRVALEEPRDTKKYFSLDDVILVKYTLHETFPERERVGGSRSNNFEIKFWTYGFFEIKVEVFLKHGKKESFKHKLEWSVTPEEMKTNGKEELSW